jgi:hypothetical protein
MMKYLILLLGFLMLSADSVTAQKKSPGDEAIYRALRGMKRAIAPADYLPVMDSLDLQCQLQPKNWLAPYYAALSRLFRYQHPAYLNKDNRDLLKESDDLLKKAAQLSADEEIILLQAWVSIFRMAEAGQAGYGQYAEGIRQMLEKARAMNGANPRLLLMEAYFMKYLPEEISGGPNAALNLAMQAAEIFQQGELEKAPLMPTWGGSIAENLVKSLGGEIVPPPSGSSSSGR